MGKKSGKRHHWGHHSLFEGRMPSRGSSSSDSSSDSDGGRHKHKKMKKFSKKYFKLMHKFGHFGRHSRFGGHHFGHNWPQELDPMINKAECVLCCQQIKPLVTTEVLECGHIYHRLCLKGLFELSANHSSDELKVLCTQCKQQIDDNLINEFRLRFNDQTISLVPTVVQSQVMDLNN